ncbi:16S rRNA (cytosine(1402)-N(4))-methyltransferase RsmH [Campylobacter sp. 2018MI35]|uniref:16S rRNA (cytosine(1402)-N(4))-methyltransferase RsmH n=1 Tax=Campylobacter sp. 2018MI34 TaxID=2800582 RepID=UPI001908509E|nr:16S rRNA (cytosine(1402)-N(4))-methyltransferase RsmH [Campylobacter sp. 2018MI34]MBK1991318.1 16S rRNA (cytosine(1402)-N(4))-methyltransferase RsmH [Campylobacter sp. 2018MI34]
MHIPHIPVLQEEVSIIFDNLTQGVFLDCTLGYAGHSKMILKKHPEISLVGCDQDKTALEFSSHILREFKDRIILHHCNFNEILDKVDIKNIRGILADIGVSSLQLDQNKRGFSINSDFLDMRMDQDKSLSAFEVVNFYSQDKLTFILKEYGELSDAWNLAQKIIQARNKKQITSAKELKEIIGFSKVSSRKIQKATLVFQAIRIEVNKELEVLKEFLTQIENLKLQNCILAIISFHSLEDRIVKNFFKKWEKKCICDDKMFKCECNKNNNLGKIINKKVITPKQDEINLNPRSSCAKLRAFYFNNMDF